MASPWDYPDTFQKAPGLIIRAVVDQDSWEVIKIDARLLFSTRVLDIMLPSRYSSIPIC